MQKIFVKIKKLNSDAKIPIYATPEAAGFDIYSLQDITLQPGETTKVPTGVVFEVPQGFYLRVEDRSGMALKGIHKVGGIVDSDYRGELFIVLHNSKKEPYKIEKHDRIAQCVITPVHQAQFDLTESLSETQRGSGGFHSTGKK